MAHFYIAFVDTPGLFAGLIRRFLKQKYIHVVLSLDSSLEEAYSIGRRHPAVPLAAGFTREDKRKILKKFPQADYMICRINCSAEQLHALKDILKEAHTRRFHYHYAVLGLPFILLDRPFYQKNHYTCSSWLARVLEETGIFKSSKHFSLVTPKDFFESFKNQSIFEGPLSDLIIEDKVSCENQTNYLGVTQTYEKTTDANIIFPRCHVPDILCAVPWAKPS